MDRTPDAPCDPVSASVPDWSRERIDGGWAPAKRLLRATRQYQAARARGGRLGRLASRRWAASHRFWSIVTQCDIPLTVEIDGGL